MNPVEKPDWWKYTKQYATAGIKSLVLKRQAIFLTVFVTSVWSELWPLFYREGVKR